MFIGIPIALIVSALTISVHGYALNDTADGVRDFHMESHDPLELFETLEYQCVGHGACSGSVL
jgi:hypothetical protein